MLRLLLALLLAIQGLLAGSAAAADAPAGTWVLLDGQKVLEVRVAAGAQSPQEAAQRISRELLLMAQDSSRSPELLVVEERPPYWMVAERQADGRTVPWQSAIAISCRPPSTNTAAATAWSPG